MALKASDQAKLDHIDKTISILKNVNLSAQQIKEQISKELAPDFEASTGQKIQFVEGDSTEYKLLDFSKDYYRVRDSNDDNKVLRTRCNGVHIEVKTFKRDEFTLTNSEIAFALEALADKMRNCNIKVSTMKSGDLNNSYFTAASDCFDGEDHEDSDGHIEVHDESTSYTAEEHYFNEPTVLKEVNSDFDQADFDNQEQAHQPVQQEQAHQPVQQEQAHQPVQQEQAHQPVQHEQAHQHVQHEQAHQHVQQEPAYQDPGRDPMEEFR
jgi:hypothetical protein